MIRRIAFWLFTNFDLGPLAPHVMALALSSPAKKVSDVTNVQPSQR